MSVWHRHSFPPPTPSQKTITTHRAGGFATMAPPETATSSVYCSASLDNDLMRALGRPSTRQTTYCSPVLLRTAVALLAVYALASGPLGTAADGGWRTGRVSEEQIVCMSVRAWDKRSCIATGG